MPAGSLTSGVMAQIRRRDPELADLLDAKAELTDAQGARLDAWMYGQGYLVDGRRVAPESVVLVRTPQGVPR